jgi:hypothetical protein
VFIRRTTTSTRTITLVEASPRCDQCRLARIGQGGGFGNAGAFFNEKCGLELTHFLPTAIGTGCLTWPDLQGFTSFRSLNAR